MALNKTALYQHMFKIIASPTLWPELFGKPLLWGTPRQQKDRFGQGRIRIEPGEPSEPGVLRHPPPIGI